MMTEALTAAGMRAIEAAAIASGKVTGLELMERAGCGVVEAILAEWPDLDAPRGGAAPAPPGYFDNEEDRGGARRAVVLCGPGGNGGDGFVVARLLKARGWAVAVFLCGDADRLPADAKANYARWLEIGEVAPIERFADCRSWGCDLVIDALFGTGLTRAIDDPGSWDVFRDLSDATSIRLDTTDEYQSTLRNKPPLVVSVDLPSGLGADDGEVIGGDPPHGRRAIRAALTVTFHALKRGHLIADGPRLCGKVVVKDIGL